MIQLLGPSRQVNEGILSYILEPLSMQRPRRQFDNKRLHNAKDHPNVLVEATHSAKVIIAMPLNPSDRMS